MRRNRSLHFRYWLLGWEYRSVDSHTSDFLNSFHQRELIMIRFTMNPDYRHAAQVSPPITSELRLISTDAFLATHVNSREF